MKRFVVATVGVIGLLVAATPAAAAPVKTTIPLFYSATFGGYLAEGSYTTVAADFTVPKVTCTAKTPESGVVAGVVAPLRDGKFSYGAVEIHCVGGVVTYTAAIVVNAGPISEIKETTVKVSPGDVVRSVVKESKAGGASVTVADITSKTSKTEKSTKGYGITEGQYNVTSLDDYVNGVLTTRLPLLAFKPVTFTKATDNGHKIGLAKLVGRIEWTSNGKAKGQVKVLPSVLKTSNAFTLTFKHS
jgi:Peptidase A4 family